MSVRKLKVVPSSTKEAKIEEEEEEAHMCGKQFYLTCQVGDDTSKFKCAHKQCRCPRGDCKDPFKFRSDMWFCGDIRCEKFYHKCHRPGRVELAEHDYTTTKVSINVWDLTKGALSPDFSNMVDYITERYDLVFFDFDGTLADTLPIYNDFWQRLGIKKPPYDKQTTREIVLNELGCDKMDVVNSHLELLQSFLRVAKPLPAFELFIRLAEAHYIKYGNREKVGLATNSIYFDKWAMAAFYNIMSPKMDCFGEVVHIHNQPKFKGHPDRWRKYLSRMGIGRTRKCLLIDDSLPACKAAIAAGFDAIWCDSPFLFKEIVEFEKKYGIGVHHPYPCSSMSNRGLRHSPEPIV